MNGFTTPYFTNAYCTLKIIQRTGAMKNNRLTYGIEMVIFIENICMSNVVTKDE